MPVIVKEFLPSVTTMLQGAVPVRLAFINTVAPALKSPPPDSSAVGFPDEMYFSIKMVSF